MKIRKCEICGAKVTNINPKCTTCDPVCTRAKHNGIDRVRQIALDIVEDNRREMILSHLQPQSEKE